ncbi:MAG: FAD-dependent oxidoreductase [Clostridiales bacterium]|nr:FAD-dependent oxidoreductase [Clostridiales bacterium]
MVRIVIVGGGWAGCAAAVQAAKSSLAQVVLIERTDMLLGTGLVGGIEGIRHKYTFSGSVFFQHMKSLNLYTLDRDEILERVSSLGLLNVFNS